MGYVAARGGEEAIQRAELLYRAWNGQVTAELVRAIERALPYLVDRIIGEGSLYAPDLAALAIAQTGGDLYEAVLLVRAYRSTQPRLAYAEPISQDRTLTVRRISAAFKDVPGGQILGPTLDYSHRVLHFHVADGRPSPDGVPDATDRPVLADAPAPATYPTVAAWERQGDLVDPLPTPPAAVDPATLPDLTREPITYPAPRAHRLQALSRADTGGVLALGYSSMRGYGMAHPTVNELRLAYADVRLRHPLAGVAFSAGRVRVSHAEVATPFVDGAAKLGLGFAATLGWNEVKVLAGSMLDLEMGKAHAHPAHEEEFVLEHTEPVEASGFCIHYKLPHYVTFNSSLDSIRAAWPYLATEEAPKADADEEPVPAEAGG